MKVNTAVRRIENAINHRDYKEADAMLKRYRRRFGNRKFTYWLRTFIANGLWEMNYE